LTDSVVVNEDWGEKVDYWKNKAWSLWQQKMLAEYVNIYDILSAASKGLIATNLLEKNQVGFLNYIKECLSEFPEVEMPKVTRLKGGRFNTTDLDYICDKNVNTLFIREV
jgi:hypothetical protein